MRLADADLWETAIELQGSPCAAGLVEVRMILKEVKSDVAGHRESVEEGYGMDNSLEKDGSRLGRRKFSSLMMAMGALSGGVLSSGDSYAFTPLDKEHPLTPALGAARQCLRLAKAMSGYECLFSKKEVVEDDMVAQTMKLKIRHNPFSVYMLFQEPRAGREVIFVDGQNENKLLVHETGLAALIGTLKLSPDDPKVLAENRYPITRAGVANMVAAVIAIWENEIKYGEVDVKYFEDAKVGDYTCRVIESVHPQPRRQFQFQMTRLWIDQKSGLAVRVQQFGFPKKKDGKPPVIEDYTFTAIQPDIRLSDRDFDKNNPNYNF